MFFKNTPLHEAIKTCSQLGYDAVEMWKAPDGAELDAAADACARYGVEFIAICTDAFSMTADGDLPFYLAGLETACAKAKRLGVKKLISQVGADTSAPRERQRGNIVRCLTAAAPVLEENGLTLVIEPLNTLVDHKGYYLVSAAEGFEIVRQVGSARVKLLYDVYHQQVSEGNIIANITAGIDLIGHLHAAGCPGRHELQSGELDYKRVFAAADAAGYEGVCALEYKPTLPPLESLAETRRLFA